MAQFFNPREAWMAHKYTAELTITQAVADRSHGGVIYYFCHIHSKMSGKIVINNVDGSRYTRATCARGVELWQWRPPPQWPLLLASLPKHWRSLIRDHPRAGCAWTVEEGATVRSSAVVRDACRVIYNREGRVGEQFRQR